jgi:hypothetical protein
MTVSVVEVLKTADSRTASQTLTSSGMTVGDTLMIFYGSDYYQLSNMPDPTSTAGTLTLLGSADIGTNAGHIKAYICPVTTGGAQTVTIPAHIDCDIFGIVLRISSTVAQDGSTGSNVDPSAPNTGTATHTAASVTTTAADRLLCVAWLVTSTGGITAGDGSYTPQGSMTKQAESDATNFSAMMVATEALPTAGASGTRTATWVTVRPYGAVSVAVGSTTPTGQPKNGAFLPLLL